jgi:glycosyltransferase involved in cell wall biosynthesis
MIADEPEAFAGRIVELFDRPDLGAELGRAGRELVEREYSWELAGDRLEALYERISAESRASAGESRSWPMTGDLVGSDA